MDRTLFFALGMAAPVVAAAFAYFLKRRIDRADAGTEKMQKIAAQIRSGAMAFLRIEYTALAGFAVLMAVILAVFLPQGGLTAVSFVLGALASGTAGWVGMHTATSAGVRTTHAARTGLAPALRVAFSSGAVMGLTAGALGPRGGRVGGRFFTKAPAPGRDLPGKVKAGTPEDAPRTPATIADNVGDNVGDV